MRSEFKEYYSSHKKKATPISYIVEHICTGLYRLYFSKLELGSEKWHRIQHKISMLSSTNYHCSIRSMFYEITMRDNCKGALYCLPGVCLNFPQKLHIGYNVFINRNVNIVARTKIVIGDNVLIGPNTVINSGSHKYNQPDILIREQGHKTLPIIIGNDVFIGGNVIILPGVTIGEGSVIGAGSVVTKSVEANTVVAGIPAVVIKKRGEHGNYK